MGTKIRVRKDHDEWDERDVESDKLERDDPEVSENPGDAGGDMPDTSEMDGDGTEPDGDDAEGDGDGDGTSSGQDGLPPVRWRANGTDWPNYGGANDDPSEWFAGHSATLALLNAHPAADRSAHAEREAAATDFQACVIAREETLPAVQEALKEAELSAKEWQTIAETSRGRAKRKDRLLEKIVGALDAMSEDIDSEYLQRYIDMIMTEINPDR